MAAKRANRRMQRGLMRCAGYTLGELATAFTITGAVATIGIPPLASAYMNVRVKTVAADFASALRLARSTAAERRAPVQVSSSGSRGWSDGWRVHAVNDVLLIQDGPLDVSVVANERDRALTYTSVGTLARAGAPQFRFHAPGFRWVTAWCVLVRPDGRPVMHSESPGKPSCNPG